MPYESRYGTRATLFPLLRFTEPASTLVNFQPLRVNYFTTMRPRGYVGTYNVDLDPTGIVAGTVFFLEKHVHLMTDRQGTASPSLFVPASLSCSAAERLSIYNSQFGEPSRGIPIGRAREKRGLNPPFGRASRLYGFTIKGEAVPLWIVQRQVKCSCKKQRPDPWTLPFSGPL